MEPTKALILVEGRDDKHVVGHLFQHHGVEGFDINEKDGCNQLLKELPVILKSSVQKHVGIVLDADSTLSGRWETIRAILLKAGYQAVPETPDPRGTIVFEGGKPNIGVWLMPDNSAAGKLEDFVAMLIPESDVCWDLAVKVVDSIQPPARQFREVDIPKARIHTWLAWRENPGVKMGEAITQKYLDPNRESANAFVKWARQIVEIQKTAEV